MRQSNVAELKLGGRGFPRHSFFPQSEYNINDGEATHFGNLPFNIFRRHGDVGPSSA